MPRAQACGSRSSACNRRCYITSVVACADVYIRSTCLQIKMQSQSSRARLILFRIPLFRYSVFRVPRFTASPTGRARGGGGGNACGKLMSMHAACPIGFRLQYALPVWV